MAGKKLVFDHSLADESLALTAVSVTGLATLAMFSCQELFLYRMEITKASNQMSGHNHS